MRMCRRAQGLCGYVLVPQNRTEMVTALITALSRMHAGARAERRHELLDEIGLLSWTQVYSGGQGKSLDMC